MSFSHDNNRTDSYPGYYIKNALFVGNINPLRAKYLRENINIYLHFMSFLH